MKSKKRNLRLVSVVMIGFFTLLMTFQVGVARYFNTLEIKQLVDGADELGYSYELIIHNTLTNTYSFEAK